MTPKQRMLASARPCGGNGPSRRSKRLAANSTGMAGYCTSTYGRAMLKSDILVLLRLHSRRFYMHNIYIKVYPHQKGKLNTWV